MKPTYSHGRSLQRCVGNLFVSGSLWWKPGAKRGGEYCVKIQDFKTSVCTACTDINGPVCAFCVHNICASQYGERSLQFIDPMFSSAGTVMYEASCSERLRVEVMDDCCPLEMGTSLFV